MKWMNASKNPPRVFKKKYVTRYPHLPDEYRIMSLSQIKEFVEADYNLEWLDESEPPAPAGEQAQNVWHAYNEEIANLKEQIEELREERDETKALNNAYAEKIQRQSEEISRLKGDFEAMSYNADQYSEQIKELQSQLSSQAGAVDAVGFAEWVTKNYQADYAALGHIKGWCLKGRWGNFLTTHDLYNEYQLFINQYKY